ncbi:MAG: fibronectin type III domain-containing protein [Chitinophagales bacterium]|nr:fibronectin type III domain-containing protein [Chitinophagales bacterium]
MSLLLRQSKSLFVFFVLISAGVLQAQQVTIGVTNYSNLSTAFAAINAGTHTGNITVNINSSFTDVATAVLNSSGAGSANYTSVLVQPTADNIVVQFAAATGRGVIELNGADNVTINGDNPNTTGTNRNLTITNSAAASLTYALVVRLVTSSIITSVDNNAITNCIINGSVTGGNLNTITSATSASATSIGIYVGGGGSTVSTTTAPSAITSLTSTMSGSTTANAFQVSNCAINQCGRGIAFMGQATTSSNGVTLTNNTIGDQLTTLSGTAPFTAPTTTVYTNGIWVQGTNAVTVTGNTIKNIISYIASPILAININSLIGTGTINISSNIINGVTNNTTGTNKFGGIILANAGAAYTINNNTISNVEGYNTTTTSSNAGGVGIDVNTAAPSGTIAGNTITKVINRGSTGYGARGIVVNAGAAVTIQNNYIANINNIGDVSFSYTYGVFGILINANNNHKIYHNSVNLYGANLGTSNNLSACIGVAATSLTGIDIRNNLLSNTMTTSNTASASVCLSLPTSGTSAMNLTLNNNMYYTGSTAGLHGVAHIGTTYTATPAGATTYAGIYTAANFNPASTTPTSGATANLRAYTSIISSAGTNDNGSYASTAAAPFTSSTNLKIDISATEAAAVNDKGANVGVTTDIEGDSRSSTPDPGADEFTISAPACTEPTAQPTALGFSGQTSVSIGGSFTPSASAFGYLVVASTSASPPSAPVDGTTYSTGSPLGSTIFVQSGSGTSFTASTLSSNTQYYFYIYAFNANNPCLGGPNYLPGSPLTGSTFTCPAVPSVGTPSATFSSITLNWTAPTSGATDYEIDVSLNNTFTLPIAGSQFTTASTTLTVSTGILPNTQYFYRIRARNAVCNSANTTTNSVTTPVVPLQYDFAQSVASYTPISGGTVHFSGTFDDAIDSIYIPSITFNGLTYINLKVVISTNGFVTFNRGPQTDTYVPLSYASGLYIGAISALGRDLENADLGTPEIRSQTIGNEVIVQWQDVKRWESGTSGTERISFQIRMNTVTGEIKMVYGGTFVSPATAITAEVGLRGQNNSWPTSILNRTTAVSSATAATYGWDRTTTGSSNTATITWNSANTPPLVPISGLTYTFTQISCVPYPTISAATSISGTNATLNWTTVTGALDGYDVRYKLATDPESSYTTVNIPSQAISSYTIPLSTLTPLSTYIFNVRSRCSSSSFSAYSDSRSFTTLNPPCSGASAGTNPPDVLICSGQTTTLTVTGATSNVTFTGVTYQWQEWNGSTWVSAVGGSGATTTSYTTPTLTANKQYRITVTCSNGPVTANGNAINVTINTPTYATLPYSQDFESWINRCSTSDVPDNSWLNTPATGNASWRRNDQGATASWGNVTSGIYSPVFSTGATSARFHSFQATSGSTGALDLYVDLNPAGTKELKFDYINPVAGAPEKLDVLLSTDGGATFPTTLLTTSSAVTSWTTQTVTTGSTSATAVIRFIATSNFGSGAADLGIDNLSLVVQAPKVVGTITATQQTGVVVAGATNVNILRIEIPVNGTIGTQTLSAVTLRSNNTNDADISEVRLWSGTASAKTTSLDFATNYTAGVVTFGSLSATLNTGTNYLWVTYNVSGGATPGNQLDALLNAGDIVISATGGATGYGTSPALSPPGSRPIVGPLCGTTYTIDNTAPTAGLNYNNFTDAILDLNLRGVNCAVVFNVKNNQTFNELTPIINTITGSSSTNTVTFQRENNTGTRPKLVGTGGVNNADPVLWLNGADWLRWDGIDIADNASNTTNTTRFEYGVALTSASGTNGAQNNIFKNSNISLNTANGNITSGVYTLSSATAANGANNNNKFLNLQISNAHRGYVINGANAAYDDNVEINTEAGGTSSISNIGSTANTASYGVLSGYVTNLKVKNTSISTFAAPVSGILAGIYASAGANSTLEVTDNTIQNLTLTGSLSQIYGVYVTSAASSVVSNNTIRQMSGYDVRGIFISSGNVTINGNTIGGAGAQALNSNQSGGLSYSCFVSSIAGTSGSPNQINSNTISNITATGGGGSEGAGIYSAGPYTTINGNNIQTVNSNGTSALFEIFGILTAGTNASITNNTINGMTQSGASSFVTGIEADGANSTLSGNSISNLNSTGTSSPYGIYIVGATANTTSNTISNISSVTGNSFGIVADGTSSANTISQNTLTNITVGASASSKTAAAIALSSTGTNNVTKNIIDNVVNLSTTNALATGITTSGTSTGNIINNMVSRIQANASNNGTACAVRAIGLSGTATIRLFNNSVYLNGVGTNASLETGALYTTTSISLDSRNNIVYNGYTGTGKHAAIYCTTSDVTYNTNLAATSNNNWLYAGTPGTNNVMLRVNTGGDKQTLTNYTTLTTGKETNSFTTAITPFVNISTSPYDLHIDVNSATLCAIHNKGVNIVSPVAVTDDIDNAARNASTPDVGADEWNMPTPNGGTVSAAPSQVCSSASVTLSVSGQTTGAEFTGKWQEDSGSGFVDVADGGVYSGATTTSLSISNTTGMNGYLYKYVVSRCSPTAVSGSSNTLTLVVNPRPTGVISGTATICTGASATLSIAVTGTGPWSGTLSNGATFSGNTSPINVSVTPGSTTTYTIATLSDANCNAGAGDLSGSAVVTVAPCGTNSWTGATSTAWHVSSNWSNGVVPTAADDATIPNVTNKPVISTNAGIKNITVAANSSVTVANGGVLTLNGSMANSGAVTIQHGGNFLQGNSSSYAGTGTFTVEKTVSNPADGYRDISAPVAATVAQLADDFPIFGQNNANCWYQYNPYPNVQVYDEAANNNLSTPSGNYYTGWISKTATTNPMAPMQGFAIRTYNGGPFTLDFTGTPNNGPYSRPIKLTLSGTPADDGWNFVGNPYPSNINWLTAAVLNPTTTGAYYLFGTTGEYSGSWGTCNSVGACSGLPGITTTIASGQGFFVKALSNSNFVLNNTVRTATSANYYKGTALDNEIRLYLHNPTNGDEILTYTDANATDNEDNGLDAVKIPAGNTVYMSYKLSGKEYTINVINEITETTVLPLVLWAKDTGLYTLQTSELNVAGYTTYFKDAETNTLTPLNTTGTGIQIPLNGQQTYEGRYSIVFEKVQEPVGITNPATANGIRIYSYSSKAVVEKSTEQPATITITNLIGQTIKEVNTTSKRTELELGNDNEWYAIVKVKEANQTKTGKVLIK